MIEDTIDNNKKLCECGCNEQIPIMNKLGKLARFKHGHNLKEHHLANKGSESNNWKGGRKKNENYWQLYIKDYYHSNKQGYVYEHIYFYEQYHKCCLLPWGVVHHIEPVTKDYCNNMPWNLQGMMHGQHSIYHNKGKEKIGNRKDHSNTVCLLCNSKKTYLKYNKTPEWFHHKNRYICKKCYDKKYHKFKTGKGSL